MSRRKGRGTARQPRDNQPVRDLSLQRLGWYVRNCAHSPLARMLERALVERFDLFREAHDDNMAAPPEGLPNGGQKELSAREKLRALRLLLEAYAEAPSYEGTYEQNVAFACAEFGLNALDAEILLLLLRYDHDRELESFVDDVLLQLNDTISTIAGLLGVDAREVRKRLTVGGPLVDCGLICTEENRHRSGLTSLTCHLQLSPPLCKAMHLPFATREEWVQSIIGRPVSTALEWEDFAHLGEMRDLAVRIVTGASQRRANGVNFLLYGPVGTGKTEFSKALGARAGLDVWSVGETDDDGAEPSRSERLAALKLTQKLLAKRGNALILFDEAEDLLASGSALFDPYGNRNGSKVFLNQMIERTLVPVVWTCNSIHGIDRAIRRRMTLAIEVKTPNRSARARLWQRALTEQQIALDEPVVRRLADRYEAPPAVVANAARAAAFCGGSAPEIEQAMAGVLETLGISPASSAQVVEDFAPELVNCTEDLALLARQLTSPSASRQWSLCISGAPGTGKSQFARYLAREMGIEVIQKRASDLLSCFVGGSEQRIAAAFKRARDDGAMLIIDEADSLLHDRSNAVRSFEVSQVNEMLTWMENHPLPFACTTNLVNRLDPASLRRFTLKLQFDALSSEQAAGVFRHFFGEPSPCRLPEGLAPGDFATVRRKRDLFGIASGNALAAWLAKEAEAKGVRSQPIGFLAVSS